MNNYEAPKSRYAVVTDEGFSGLIVALGGLGAGVALYTLAIFGNAWLFSSGYFGIWSLVKDGIVLLSVILPKLGLVLGFVALLKWQHLVLRIYVLCWLFVAAQSIFYIVSSYFSLDWFGAVAGWQTAEIAEQRLYFFVWVFGKHALVHCYFFLIVTLIFLSRRKILLLSSLS